MVLQQPTREVKLGERGGDVIKASASMIVYDVVYMTSDWCMTFCTIRSRRLLQTRVDVDNDDCSSVGASTLLVILSAPMKLNSLRVHTTTC